MEEEEEKDTLLVLRHKDGGVSLYIDEDWALERGVDPSQLIALEIPRKIYTTGTVQELREYVATSLESQEASMDSHSPT